MGNKHVLIYCPVFLPDTTGYTHAFEQLITNLLQGGFMVDVLTPQILGVGEAEPFVANNLTVYRYKPTLNVWGLGLFYQFYKQAQYISRLNQEHNYQLIFIETGDVPLLPFFLSELILKKTVVRFHSTSDTEYLLLGNHKKYKLRRWFWRFLSGKKIKHVCATNQYHLDYAINNVLHQPKVKSKHVLTNTIEVNTTDLSEKAVHLNFVLLGRMDEEGYKQKGFDVLLKALPLIKDDMVAADAKMLIIGEGSKYSNFKLLVEHYDFVALKPNLPHQQLLALLQQSHVVLLPSLYEGVSMFALEALANANAVIFSKTGGLIEMVDGNGCLVEPGNAVQLADAIRDMIQHRNLALLQIKSQQIAQRCFSKEIQLMQFEQLIMEVEL
jgi:glycosyltransferase involved in cell wall biosynthesis